MFEVYQPKKAAQPKKALWRRALPFATAGAALTLAGAIATTYPTFNRSLERAFNPRDQAEMNKSVRRVIGTAESKGYITLEYDGKEVYIDGNRINPEALTIARSDSPVLDEFYRAMGAHADGVKSGLRWIVSTPNIENESRDVNGLSIGNGIVYIDTIADDGRAKHTHTIPGTLGHESEHESTKLNGLTKLVNENLANKRALNILEEQLRQGHSDVVQAEYDIIKKRIDTANFLEKYGNDFQNVYPHEVILAKYLLEADIPSQTLKRYIRPVETSSGLERELIIASMFADMVRSNPREDAIRRLFSYATDPKYENTLTQVSAASALSYLFPEQLREHSTADVPLGSGRFASVSFGPSPDLTGIARALRGSGFSVSGLPSLEELLNPRTTPKGTYVTIRMYQGDTVKDGGRKYGLFGNKVLLIPQREGKPANDWIVVRVRAFDTDKNGRDDTLEVYYTHPSMDFEDGLMTKVDEFNRMRFVESGLVRLTADLNPNGNGIDFDLERRWKEWNLER